MGKVYSVGKAAPRSEKISYTHSEFEAATVRERYERGWITLRQMTASEKYECGVATQVPWPISPEEVDRYNNMSEQDLIAAGVLYDLPVISTVATLQAEYVYRRLLGEGHNSAEMFTLQEFPAIAWTDTAWNSGRYSNNQFEKDAPGVGEFYMRAAKRAGVSTVGKQYLHSIARFPGDPQAWVASQGDVKAVMAKRGWQCKREDGVLTGTIPLNPKTLRPEVCSGD